MEDQNLIQRVVFSLVYSEEIKVETPVTKTPLLKALSLTPEVTCPPLFPLSPKNHYLDLLKRIFPSEAVDKALDQMVNYSPNIIMEDTLSFAYLLYCDLKRHLFEAITP